MAHSGQNAAVVEALKVQGCAFVNVQGLEYCQHLIIILEAQVMFTAQANSSAAIATMGRIRQTVHVMVAREGFRTAKGMRDYLRKAAAGRVGWAAYLL